MQFGHFFRTPLTYDEGIDDIVGRIFYNIYLFNDKPISFIYYWGVGIKSLAGKPESEFVSYLDNFIREFCLYFNNAPHSEVVILTDTHAIINNIASDTVDSYYKSVKADFSSPKRNFIMASDLWKNGKKDMVNEDKMADGITARQWKENSISRLLEDMAIKHYVGSAENVVNAAKRYYRYNLIEKRLIENLYPNYFFISWNSPELDTIFPSLMPILHLHVDQQEVDSEKPWFRCNEAEQ